MTARHALELVRGQVDQSAQPFTVHSEVFLGELAPSPQRQVVRLTVTLAPDDFARARDSCSVVTLYALARNAQRLRGPPNVVASLLSEARSQASEIDDPVGDLTEIKAAIDAALQSLRGAQPRGRRACS